MKRDGPLKANQVFGKDLNDTIEELTTVLTLEHGAEIHSQG